MAKLSTPTIVLVHGGFVDGAGWEGVYNILKKDGYMCGRPGRCKKNLIGW